MRHFLRRRALGRAGLTLVELMVALMIIGVIGAMSGPVLRRYVEHARVESGLNQITADLFYARMLAVKTGYPVELRFKRAGNGCDDSEYSIVSLSPGVSEVKRTRLDLRSADCLSVGKLYLRFEPQGMLASFNNRTLTLRSGATTRSLRISVLGYVRRARS